MRMTRPTQFRLMIQNSLFYILLFSVIGLLAFFSREFRFESDWTYGSRSSLSPATQSLLKSIDEPIKFVAYVPQEPQLLEQLRKFTAKYQRVKPDISLEVVNPDLDPARAQRDGVRYLGQMAVHVGTRHEIVESTQEQTIANVLQRLSRGHERWVIFLEGHGERDPLAEHSNGLARLSSALESQGFRVQPHNLVRTQSIPDNASFVVIAAPQQDYLMGEVELLKQYVEQGGNLLWLVEPDGLQGLQGLADLLGLRIHQGTVVDANEQLHLLLGIDHPAIVPVVDYGRSPLGENLDGRQSLFRFATMVEPHPVPPASALHWQKAEFLLTLPNSWLATGALEGAVVFDQTQGDILGPIPIGVSLTRALEAPSELTSELDLALAGERQQRIIVVGDSDFLSNGFIGRGVNLDLALNMFNWLSQDDQLLSVGTVRAPDTHWEMDERAGIVMASFFLLVFPMALLATGLVIWWRRRRR